MGVQTFWLEPTEFVAVGLRRYSQGEGGFDCEHGHHNALIYTGVEPATYREENGRKYLEPRPSTSYDAPRWPQVCSKGCGYAFAPDDHWQDWQEQIYERTDTGAKRVLHTGAPAQELGIPAAEPGACWDAWWMPSARRVDGMYLMVRLPDNHDWAVDSQASNCTRPGEDHQCWVRSGDPRECKVTVGKDGNTCSAGAGSIGSPNWHGFLRNGQLVT